MDYSHQVKRPFGGPPRNRPTPTLFGGRRLDPIPEAVRSRNRPSPESAGIGAPGVCAPFYSRGPARSLATDLRRRRSRTCFPRPGPERHCRQYAGHRKATFRSARPEWISRCSHPARCRDGLHTGWRCLSVSSGSSTPAFLYDIRNSRDQHRQFALRRKEDRQGVIHDSSRPSSVGPD